MMLTLFLVSEDIVEGKHCADIHIARLHKSEGVVDEPDAILEREGRIPLGGFFGDLDEALGRIQHSICGNP